MRFTMPRFLLGVLFLVIIMAFAWVELITTAVPSTIEDFYGPGSQPMESGTLENPNKCDNCHGGYDTIVEPAFLWRGSMMSQAARDPLFFASVAIANQDAPESGDLCIRCHTPKGWLEGRSTPTDGSALTAADRQGVTCDYCHRVVTQTPLGVNPYPSDSFYTVNTYDADQDYLETLDSLPLWVGNGMYIVDSDKSKRGPFTDPDANHQFFYSPLHNSSALCGTCHDVSNPAFSAVYDSMGNIVDYAPNSWGQPAPDFNPHSQLPIERTYSEWLMSAYNSPGGIPSTAFGGNLANVSSCQDCHMRDTTGYGCNKTPPLRDNLPMHDLTGANTFVPLIIDAVYPGETDAEALAAGILRARYMLRNAATMTMTVGDTTNPSASVHIINETGHKLPSGYPEGRRIWLQIRAWSESGELFASGAYDTTTAVLTHDDQIKVYEVKPGISPGLASALGLESGPSFHFVLNDSLYKDNRIPPRGFTNANFDSIQAAPVGYSYADEQYWDDTEYNFGFTDSVIAVEATLYYQTTTKEYVEFLRDENVTNSWGNTLYDLWSTHGKSRPELMQYVHWGAPVTDNDHDGYIAAVDCDDNNPDIRPGATELLNCIDDNCDGLVDEDFNSEIHSYWTGCADTSDWFNIDNWNLREVPAPDAHVVIPELVLGDVYPVIEDTVVFRSLHIEQFANLEISPFGHVTVDSNAMQIAAIVIEGEFLNYGTLEVEGSDTIGIQIGPTGSFDIYGLLEVEGSGGDGIKNEGSMHVTTTGIVRLSSISGQPVVNSSAAIFTISGEVIVED